MQVAGVARRASRVLRAPLSLHSHCCVFLEDLSLSSSSQARNFRTSSTQNLSFSGCSNGGLVLPSDWQCQWRNPEFSLAHKVSFSSTPDVSSGDSADSVKEVYDKLVESVKVKRSAPPNKWLWTLIQKCENEDDVNLLFEVLKQLRIFRLSNLRIHDNYNCNLCQEVAKACLRAGAVDFGKKVLTKHNIYGLSPTVGSANQLLSHAQKQKDIKLMQEVMSLLKKNDLPLQPATADIIFSICYGADEWGLISKYSKRFLKAGVKLRKTTFDIWMEFASQRGDVESLWKIEKLRSDMYNKHTIKSAISCAKGFLLERKPDCAAAVIQVVNQNFPDSKRQDIIVELQKLVSLWPVEVVKHQKQEDRKLTRSSRP